MPKRAIYAEAVAQFLTATLYPDGLLEVAGPDSIVLVEATDVASADAARLALRKLFGQVGPYIPLEWGL